MLLESDSQFCERFSRFRLGVAGRAVACCLAIALSGAIWAAPEDDYKRGSQALRAGDIVAAMAALRRAAGAGHAPSQALLASVLDQAELDDEALGWYRKAAEQGDPDGEFGIGSMYLSGEGVKQDLAQAYFWFLRAGEKGHEPATVALADSYLRADKGELAVGPDKMRAAEWLRKAAALNYLPALDALARAYRAGGFGLSPDAIQADQYASKASAIRQKVTADKGRKKK